MIAACPAGVNIQCDNDLLVIRSDALLRIASTAVHGGGLSEGHCIVSARVPPTYFKFGGPATPPGWAAAAATRAALGEALEAAR